MHFRDIDLRPVATAGWRALFVFEDAHEATPLVGWLVQERCDQNGDPTGGKPGDRERRIVAAVESPDGDGMPAAVGYYGDLGEGWDGFERLLAPDEPVPDPEAIAAIRARKAEARADHVARRERLAAEDAPKVLAILEGSPFPMTAEAVASRLGKGGERAIAALGLLRSQGQASIDGRWAWSATGA